VSESLFDTSAGVFLQELRKGRYPKTLCTDRRVLATVVDLGIGTEGAGAVQGVTLLTPDVVVQLLQDRRRVDLVEPFKLALLKLTSQEAAKMMALADYPAALPLALDAVKQGQRLFLAQPALEMFPLYLLAAQANLGLRRSRQCEDFLSLASHLVVQEAAGMTHMMQAHLSRLYGQLYVLEGRLEEALEAFAEDVYYCSLEHGPNDVRTSLGYYNLGKVFQSLGQAEQCLACNDQSVTIWVDTLRSVVLGHESVLAPRAAARESLPLNDLQLLEVMDMLRDIKATHQELLGESHPRAGDLHFVLGLCLMYLQKWDAAEEELGLARDVFQSSGEGEPLEVVNEAFSLLQSRDLLPRLQDASALSLGA